MSKIQEINYSFYNKCFKLIFFLFGLGYIIHYLVNIPISNFSFFTTFDFSIIISGFCCLAFLSILNWFGETKKWQYLCEGISFKMALSQTLVGHALSIFTPQKIGEYGGKCLFYEKEKRPKIIALSIVGQMSQLLVTLCFGLVGVVWSAFYKNTMGNFTHAWFWLIMAFAVLLLFKPVRLYLKKVVLELKKIKTNTILNSVLWSSFRYIVFSHQFLFLLWIFGVEVNYSTGFLTISLVYLFSSIIPIFAIADSLVKGSMALTLFSWLGIDSTSILIVIVLMWISNTMIPALMGYLYMIKWQPKAVL